MSNVARPAAEEKPAARKKQAAPAYQVYPKVLPLDVQKYLSLSSCQRGLYWDLAMLAWVNDGLPDDTRSICAQIGLKRANFERFWSKLRAHFGQCEDGRLRLPWQELQRAANVLSSLNFSGLRQRLDGPRREPRKQMPWHQMTRCRGNALLLLL